MSEAQMVNGVEITPLTSWDDIPVPETDTSHIVIPDDGEIVDGKFETESEQNSETTEAAPENIATDIEEESEEVSESSEETTDSAPEEVIEEARTLDDFLKEAGLDSASLKVKHKQDGKEVELPLSEVINKGFGEDSVEKRFSALNEEKKAFASEKAELETQVSSINTYINNMGTKYSSGDALGAVEYLGDLLGVPGYELKENLINSLLPEIESRYEKSEEQLSTEYREAQANYKFKKAEEKENHITAQQAASDLDKRISDLRTQSAITDDEWDNAYQNLDSRLDASYSKIPLDMIAQEVESNRAQIKAESYISDINENLLRPEVIETAKQIMLENPDFSEQDIKDIINEAYQSEVKTTAGKVISAKAQPKMAKQKIINKTPEKPEMSYAEKLWKGIE